MKVLLTGDKGFVGVATQKYLEKQKIEVVGFDIMDRGDIRDKKLFEDHCREIKPDRIVHLAAIARFSEADKDPKLCHEVNVLGTKNVAEIAGKYHVPLIYASTGSVYMPISQEPPITEEFEAKGNSVYACSKYQGELYIKQHAQPWMILRLAHLYGKDKRMHGLIGGYLDRIKFGMAPILYGGAQSNDFCYIEDVARAFYLAVTASWDKWNQIYNIGTGEELSAEEAGDKVIKIWNETHPDQKFEGEVDKRKGRTVDPSRFVYDVSKAARMLNFKSKFDFESGLRDMFNDGKA